MTEKQTLINHSNMTHDEFWRINHERIHPDVIKRHEAEIEELQEQLEAMETLETLQQKISYYRHCLQSLNNCANRLRQRIEEKEGIHPTVELHHLQTELKNRFAIY